MSRYIDADALLKNMYTWLPPDPCGIEGREYPFETDIIVSTIQTIEEEPSIDIVRCRECKYAHMTYSGECKYCDNITDDDGNVIEVYYDGSHFCSDGERSE